MVWKHRHDLYTILFFSSLFFSFKSTLFNNDFLWNSSTQTKIRLEKFSQSFWKLWQMTFILWVFDLTFVFGSDLDRCSERTWCNNTKLLLIILWRFCSIFFFCCIFGHLAESSIIFKFWKDSFWVASFLFLFSSFSLPKVIFFTRLWLFYLQMALHCLHTLWPWQLRKLHACLHITTPYRNDRMHSHFDVAIRKAFCVLFNFF